MTANPLVELARTLVALRALATDLGIEWELVLAAADGITSDSKPKDAESKAHTDSN